MYPKCKLGVRRAADNMSAHSCQLWARRDECLKNAEYMASSCSTTCSEHLFREQAHGEWESSSTRGGGGSRCSGGGGGIDSSRKK